MDLEIFNHLFDSPALFFALASLGLCSGFLAGLLGVGGGFILVPGLYIIFTFMGLESVALMHFCIGTSLAIIVPTGFSSARAHWRIGALDFFLLPRIGAGIVGGALLGTFLASQISGVSLQIFFALMLFILSILMMLDPARFKGFKHEASLKILAPAGVIIGTISSLMGVGGATLSVPFMRFFKIPIHRAIGTASALGLFISVPATLGYMVIGAADSEALPFSIGYINMAAWILITPFSFAMAPVGAWAAHKISTSLMRKIFAFFMILIALQMGVNLL